MERREWRAERECVEGVDIRTWGIERMRGRGEKERKQDNSVNKRKGIQRRETGKTKG